MEQLIANGVNIILLLIELAIILLLIDGIMSIIIGMLGLSWKKVLMWAAAIFGLLWLRDFVRKRKEKVQVENVEELTEEDFETIEE